MSYLRLDHPGAARQNPSPQRRWQRACWSLCLTMWFAHHGFAADERVVPPTVERFISNHCIDCHRGESAEAGLDLESLSREWDRREVHDRWVRLLDRVQRHEMPPVGEVQPTADERRAFLDRLKTTLLEINRQRQRQRGRTPIRRMNRYEYERSVQDLLAITTPLAPLLPEETPLHGFDTVSDGLRFSPLHVEKYLVAAERAIDEAIRLHVRPEPINRRFHYVEQPGVLKNLEEEMSVVRRLEDAIVMFTDASYIVKLEGLRIEEPGMYRVRARGRAFQSDRPVVLRLNIGNWSAGASRVIGFFDLPPGESTEVEVVARFENNEYFYPAPDDLMFDKDGQTVWHHGGEKYTGAGLALEWIEVEGPLVSQWPPESNHRVFGDTPIKPLDSPRWHEGQQIAYEVAPVDPERALVDAVVDFATRAFRRPTERAECDAFIDLGRAELASGRTFEQAMRVAARGILTSPQFLILHENPGRLDAYALASRLSYFLWGTAPDETLLQLAAAGTLLESATLREQTERMLNDSRSAAWVESFVDQWLELRRINATTPDSRLYPEYDELLRLSMLSETHAFFAELLRHDLSISNFIDSDFVMLNRRLAEHYGIEGVMGQSMSRVELADDSPRGGVLTQASVLKVTANGTVTSPVSRGAFVLARLLNDPPAPPPPGIGSIEPDTRGATTVREQLARHRDDASCAACHTSIDPPGFALESFDVIGGWRTRYRSIEQGIAVEQKLRGRKIWEYRHGPPVDASGITADGESFQNIHDFKRLLLQQREQVARAITSQLLVYATGQRIELADRDVIDTILMRTADSGHGLRSIVHEIIQSDLFQSK